MSAFTSLAQRRDEIPAHVPAAALSSVCFIGMTNLPVLAREYNNHPIGGEQVQQTLLAKSLAQRGYQVSMVTADYGQPEGAIWDSVRTHKAFGLDEGLPGIRFFHPRWSGLWRALGRADADVYYTSCAGALTGQMAIFCRQHGRRLIFRVASDADCELDLPLLKYWRDKKLYEYGLNRADAVLVQSAYQRDLLKKNYGVDSSIAGMLVESGNAERSFAQRDYTVSWVNNFRSLKRPDILLDAAEALPHLSFHMAGGAAPGHEKYFDAVSAVARSRFNVKLHGLVPYHDIGELYERARVCVNTSDIEGFPNSYLQAWSSGTPVVAFFDPDELIAKEGLGIAVRTPKELVDAIVLLATDENAWLAMSKRCLHFMQRHYSEDTVLTPYRAIIDDLGRRQR